MMLTYETAVILVCILSSLLCVGLAVWRKLGWQTGLGMSALSLLLCMLCARGFYILVCSTGGFWGPLFPAQPYYYSFGGGVLGFLLSLFLTARIFRKPFAAAADAFTPVGLFAIAGLRFAETLSDFGWGDFVEAAWLQRYPFAIQNMYEEWCAAIFNLEALCALVILAVLLMAGGKLAGRRLQTALIWWCATQIFCESLRVESIQWGFVRVQQLQCAILMAVVLFLCTLRTGSRRKALSSWIGLLAGAGLVVFLEYAIDKMPWPTFLNYIMMAIVLGVMGWCVQRMLPRRAPSVQA